MVSLCGGFTVFKMEKSFKAWPLHIELPKSSESRTLSVKTRLFSRTAEGETGVKPCPMFPVWTLLSTGLTPRARRAFSSWSSSPHVISPDHRKSRTLSRIPRSKATPAPTPILYNFIVPFPKRSHVAVFISSFDPSGLRVPLWRSAPLFPQKSPHSHSSHLQFLFHTSTTL